MAKKTMKASELIFWLTKAVEKFGDLPVYLQEDTEGNGYGTLNKEKSLFVEQDDDTKKWTRMILQPFEEHLNYEEISEENYILK